MSSRPKRSAVRGTCCFTQPPTKPGAPLPRFPAEACGVDTLHAPFLNERRVRGPLWHSGQEIRVKPGFGLSGIPEHSTSLFFIIRSKNAALINHHYAAFLEESRTEVRPKPPGLTGNTGSAVEGPAVFGFSRRLTGPPRQTVPAQPAVGAPPGLGPGHRSIHGDQTESRPACHRKQLNLGQISCLIVLHRVLQSAHA